MLDVEVTPRAALQLEAAAVWWASNRPTAPDAIRLDFQEAKVLLSRQPGVGARSSTARYPDLRRLYLSRVRYEWRLLKPKCPVTLKNQPLRHSGEGRNPGQEWIPYSPGPRVVARGDALFTLK